MNEDNLGSGLKLTDDWDIEVDSTGDLETVDGNAELQKDGAMLSAITLEKQLGKTISARLDSNSLKEIELLVKRTLLSDKRIKRVVHVNAHAPRNSVDTIEIECEVLANDRTDYNLIFEVTP